MSCPERCCCFSIALLVLFSLHCTRYWETHHQGKLAKIHQHYLDLRIPKEELQKLEMAEVKSDAMVHIEKVAMLLTIAAFGHNLSEFKEVRGFMYDIKDEPQFHWHDHFFNGLYYTDTAADLLLPQVVCSTVCVVLSVWICDMLDSLCCL